MKAYLAILTAAVAVAGLAAAPANAQKWQPGLRYYVTEFAAADKLEHRYDFASCFGIQRYGTTGLNTREYGWQKGYLRFQCSYYTADRRCYHAQYQPITTARPWSFWMQQVVPPRCYG